MADPKHLVRAALADDASCIVHPKNARSEIWMTRLSDQTGLTRVGVNLGRIAPGKEAFVPHAHLHQEEWVFVVAGRGIALIGEERHPIGPGDFLGYPCDGTVHQLINDGAEDLVVLQGSERVAGDVGLFPTLGAIGIPMPHEGQMAYVEDRHIERIPFTRWIRDQGSDDSRDDED
ncbi:MAG: cupin domain-containing protein [Polyangiaceae bacterium]